MRQTQLKRRQPKQRICKAERCNWTIGRGEAMCQRCLGKLPEAVRIELTTSWRESSISHAFPDRRALDALDVARSHLEARR